jgi:TP901 family phage tail tape measure protein
MSKFVLTAQLQLQAPTNTGQVVKQIQNQLNNVNVKVNATGAAKAKKQIQQLSTVTKQAGNNAAAMGRSFAVSFKRFAAFSIATRAVGLLTRGISDAVGEALDFERQLIKVAQVTGKTVGELNGLVREVRNLATGLGVSSKSLLGVSRVLAQAGLSAGETKVALSALAKSSLAATFEDITQTAEGAIAIFNQFGQGAAALEGQLGSINAVAGQFAVEAGDIIATVRRTGGVFKAAGGDLNELIALFTSVRATTRESAESIATGLRTIFTRIQRPTTIKYLEDLGIKLTDTEGKFVGPFEAIKRLSAAMGDMEAGDLKFVQIAEQLGGFRQIGKIIPLLTQFSTAEDALAVAMAGTNSLTEDAEKAQGSLLVRMTSLKEEFLELIGKMTQSNAFKIMANGAIALASAIIKVADAVRAFMPIIAALGAVKLFGAISGFAGGFGGMMRGAGGARAFASGGLVPGSGNRDSVPAMLTPGEFVIRKSSVGKIGASNLEGMNAKGYASGGSIVGQKRVSMISADVFDSIKNPAKPVSTADIMGQTPSKAWVNPVDGQKPVSIENAFAGNKQGLKLATQHVANNIGKLPKKIQIEGLVGKDSEKFDNAIDSALVSAINTAGSSLSKTLGGGGFKWKGKSESASSGLNKGARGTIFEEVLAGLAGAPLNSVNTAGDDETAPFDFTRGIGKLAKIYQDTGSDMFVDAKLTGGRSGSVLGKVNPETLKINQKKPTASRYQPKHFKKKIMNQAMQDLWKGAWEAGNPPGKGTGTTAQMGMGIATQPAHFGGPIKGFASGGAVTDTVPAMLTPGEFVVNKKAAQNIGASTLGRMNKKGVTGFAAGGPVGFAAGGGVGMGGGGMGLLMMAAIPQLLSQFIEMNSTMESFMSSLTKGVAMLFAFGKAIQINKDLTMGHGKGMQMATSASHKETGEAIKAAAAEGKVALAAKNADAALKKLGGTSQNLNSAQLKTIATQNQKIQNIGKQISAGNALAGAEKAVTQALRSQTQMIRTSLSGNDMKIFQQGLTQVGRSTKDVGVRFQRVATFIDNFSAATVRGMSAEQAATAATLASVQGEKIKVGIITKVTNSLQAMGNKVRTFGERFQFASQMMMGGIMAFQVIIDTLKAASDARIDSALSTGNLGGRADAVDAEGNPLSMTNDFDTARGEIAGNVRASKFSSAAQGAMMGGMAGMALGGPMGAMAGMAIGGAASFMTFDEEAETKKLNDKMAKAELTALSVRLAADLEAIQEAGEIQIGTARDISADFQSARSAIEDVTNAAEKEKMAKELDASMISAAATTGGLAKNAADLATILTALGDGASVELKAKMESAAKAAFNLKEAMMVAHDAMFDAAKITGVFNRATLGVNNFVQSLETGSSRLGPAIAILEESLKNFTLGDMAGANIDSLRTEAFGAMQRANVGFGSEVGQALDRQFDQLKIAADAQSKLPIAMNALSGSLTAGMTDAKIKDTMLDTLVNNLGVAVDSDVGKTIAGQISQLKDEDFRSIKAGSFDFSGFLNGTGKELSNLGKAALHAVKALERQEKVITTLTKKRIALEHALMQAQKSAIDMQLEAAKIMAEFGGAAVTSEMQKQAALDKSNISTQRLGLGAMTTGSASEVTAMSQAMMQQFASLEIRARTPGAFAGAQGMDEDKRKDLIAAQKELANTTRQLIKINRESLQILEKKNQKEKDALQAAISGDIEKYIKDSMSVGATAMIATGNEAWAGAMFGAEGVAGAFENIQTMQEGGVQEIFGQRLGGAGGVAENAAGAALGLRGIVDPRMAQLMAGTTAEEEKLKAKNRALAGSLGGIGETMADMVEMQVQSAQINISQANVVFNREIQKGNAQLLSRGGTVYAADGVEMFKPKGTDTVPAVLTPGEVVTSKRGVAAGNNRAILRKMNRGEAVKEGGGGQMIAAIDPSIVNTLVTGLDKFNKGLSRNIDKLKNTKFKIQLETTNVNVNLNGGNFLSTLKEEVKAELMADVGERIKDLKFSQSGGATFEHRVLDS